jgi:hypothetical protein
MLLPDSTSKVRTACHGASPPPTKSREIDAFLAPHIRESSYVIMHTDGEQCFNNIGSPERIGQKAHVVSTQVSHSLKMNKTTGKREVFFTQLQKVPLTKGTAKKWWSAMPKTQKTKLLKTKRQKHQQKLTRLVWGGTQYMDGGFKHMRASWPQTMNHSTKQNRLILMRWIRLWQFRTWYSGQDYMKEFGRVLGLSR